LILPYVAFQLPIGVFIISGFLQSFPQELEEAAMIDGCSIYRIIFEIVMPLVKPVLVTIAVITFIADWNEFIMMQTYLTGDTLKTLQYAVFRFSGQYASNYAVQYAVMMIISIPSLIIYLIFSEQISKGIMLGAVKG
jgi:raffinose/stachyose/melibiose transport system permease protein